ncbi:hypothetical protein [Amycolatopsis sp. ATCC 39116]|uniref:hypothetical protein n=1 Tax=Amycolatopsis sp. (strain ATCC 39116 / 75iv2) TaxID=385957 RepID=UPI0012FAB872|nr:hypothetical protein [Amycolatopsis sp. ATCC 39116]
MQVSSGAGVLAAEVADVLRGVVLLDSLDELGVLDGALVVLLAAALVGLGAGLALDEAAWLLREACAAQELPGSQAVALSRTRGAASSTAGNVRFMCDLSVFRLVPQPNGSES